MIHPSATGPSDAERDKRRRIRAWALGSILALFAALTTLTLGLLLNEFTREPPQDRTSARQTDGSLTLPGDGETSTVGAAQPDAAERSLATAAGGTQATAASMQPIVVSPPWMRPADAAVITRIGVGSCLHQNHPQPIWQSVIEADPDLLLMLGDNVYGDIHDNDPDRLAAAYRKQAEQPELKAARQAFPFLAIWDDHDYGRNDAGAGFPFQPQAAELFRQYWSLPEAQQPDGGIYYSKTIGPEGQRVQFIMLDTRTFRTALKRKTAEFEHWGKYEPTDDPHQSMLGATQWDWLEAQLQKPAEVRLIISSVQVLANGHGRERWGNLPQELDRLRSLLRDTGTRGVVLLSGDRHSASIYRTGRDQEAAQPHLIELTASSLNRSYGPAQDTRLPPLVSPIYYPENFGLIDIDWQNQTILLSVHGISGKQALALQVPFTELGLGPDAQH